MLRRAERKEAATRERKRGANTRTIGGGSVVRRLRQIVSGTFDHAVATLRAESNPAGPIRRAFKTAKTTHKTPLTPPQIGEFLRALDAYHGSFMTAAALRLLWLTVARPSEVVGARWVEFDLDGEIWKIPAARMKSREDHAVPLPAQAVELLRRLRALSGTREFIFPHRDRRDSPMTYDALNKGIARMGLTFKTTPHASRTTASTMLNELGFRHDVIERQLAHQERNAVRRAYNRAEYLAERREMIRQWADMLDAWRDRTKVLPPRSMAA
jgi:integrase